METIPVEMLQEDIEPFHGLLGVLEMMKQRGCNLVKYQYKAVL